MATEEKEINEIEETEDQTVESSESIQKEATDSAQKTEKTKSKKKFSKEDKQAKELQTAKEEIEQLNEKLLRQFAEFDNFRKRTQKEKESTFTDAKIKTITPIIEIIDNFERAMETKCSDETYKQGIEMIFNQLKEKLSSMGVNEMDCLGKTLDPNFHQAVMHIEDPEKGVNEIVSVFQKGYVIGEKVLRCAMVQVAN